MRAKTPVRANCLKCYHYFSCKPMSNNAFNCDKYEKKKQDKRIGNGGC